MGRAKFRFFHTMVGLCWKNGITQWKLWSVNVLKLVPRRVS